MGKTIKRKETISIICLVIFTILFWTSLHTYSPLLSNYAKDLGASFAMVGVITGAYGLSQALLRIPLGIISDKYKKQKPFIYLGSLFSLASALLFISKKEVQFVFIARLLAGISAATWVNITVLYANYHDNEEIPKALGFLTSLSRVGMLVGTLLSTFFGNKISLPKIFQISALSASLSIFSLFFIKEPEIKKTNYIENEPTSTFFNKKFIFYTFLVTIVQLITFGTTFTFTPLIAKNLGADIRHLGILSLNYILPQILLGPFIGGVILKKLGEEITLFTGFLLYFIANISIPFTSSFTLLCFFQVLSGIANTFTFSLLGGLVLKGVNVNNRSRVTGIFQSIYGLGMLLGPIVMGRFSETFGLRSGFKLMAIISFLTMLIITLFFKKIHD